MLFASFRTRLALKRIDWQKVPKVVVSVYGADSEAMFIVDADLSRRFRDAGVEPIAFPSMTIDGSIKPRSLESMVHEARGRQRQIDLLLDRGAKMVTVMDPPLAAAIRLRGHGRQDLPISEIMGARRPGRIHVDLLLKPFDPTIDPDRTAIYENLRGGLHVAGVSPIVIDSGRAGMDPGLTAFERKFEVHEKLADAAFNAVVSAISRAKPAQTLGAVLEIENVPAENAEDQPPRP